MYYHKITEYEIKCCMNAHHGAPRAPSSRGELYRHKTLFLDDFPIFFYYPNGTWTHPPTSKLFLDFFNFAKPLRNNYLYFRRWFRIVGKRCFDAGEIMSGNCSNLSLLTHGIVQLCLKTKHTLFQQIVRAN